MLNQTLFYVSEGFYIYHEGDNVGNGQTARLISPAISTGPDQICVQFHYYMYGSDNRNLLRVLVKRGSSEEQVWERAGMQSPSWLSGSVSVSKPLGTSLEVSQQSGLTSCGQIYCLLQLCNVYHSKGVHNTSNLSLSFALFVDMWPVTPT